MLQVAMESKKLKKIMQEDKKYLFQNYGDRLPVCFTRGEGSILFDQNNKRYIDFFSGIAVSNLGYNHPAVSKALHAQVDRILHSSNWYYNNEQIQAAALISGLAFPGKTLFVNSGTEANEAAIKLARKYGLSTSPDRYEIISFHDSFHGRTMGSMSATAQKKIHDGFGPLPAGFKYLPFNDINAFREEADKNPNIAAILIELIQGESGIKVAEKNYVKELFALCKQKGILTIVDEVQTGMGRTGKPFAYQHYGISPDAITLAKGLGAGLPIGALHTKDALVQFFPKGTHGTTFGGNHMSCAAAVAVLKELNKKTVYANIKKSSEYIFQSLKAIQKKVSYIKEIRGMGLHIGFELTRPGSQVVSAALDKGLIINCTSEKVIRIMPPLVIPLAVVKEGMKILEDILINEEKKGENTKG